MYKSMIKPGMEMKTATGGVVISNKEGREGFLEEVASEQRLEKDECDSQGYVWGKIVQRE